MSSSSANFTSLIESLAFLSKDHRLARVFSSNSWDTCDLTLWLLEIRQGDFREYRLMYAWIVPRMPQNLNSWFYKSLFEYKVSPSTFQMYRLTFHHTGDKIFDLVKELCKGNSLEESCQQLKLDIPVKIKDPKNHPHPCSQFSLAESPQELSQTFTVRPVTFVKPAWHHLAEIDDLKPVSSPNGAVPAFVGSLNRLRKLSLFQMNKLQSIQQDELSKRCLSTLKEDTGLDFCGADSKRLGNLEWLCFPVADDYERLKVRISFDSPAHTATIEIPSGTLPIGTQATIRCRLYNDREISLDCLKTVQIPNSIISISFTSQQEITKYLVTIWINLLSGDTEEIWYESTASILKRINISQGLVAFQAEFTSNWLKEVSKYSKLKKKVEQAQIVRQAYYQKQTISQYEPSSWITEGKQVYSLAKRLFSKPSGGLFIKNGWDSDKQEPGIFTFFKWFKSVTDDGSASKVLIADPYFDESGVTEVIARVGAVQVEYVVISNTQANSSYPEDASLEREPARAKRLKETCSRIDIILSKLKFKLLDLRSLGEKKDQLFHDRYILVYGDQGNVKSGYHLSNSIQGATKSHPLLITPIPSDILTNVEEYVSTELINPRNERYSVITLFSSLRLGSPSFEHLPEAAEISHVSLLFSELFKDKDLLSLNEADLCQALKNYGELEDGLGSFQFQENNKAKYYFDQFTQALLVADLDVFIKLWVALFSWLEQIYYENDYLNQFILSDQNRLGGKIQEILIEIPTQKTLPVQLLDADNTHFEVVRLSDLIKIDFPEAMQEAYRLLMLSGWQTFSCCLQDNGIRYMVQMLIKLDPEKLVKVISELTKTFLAIPDDEANSLKLWNFRYTIAFILKQVVDDVFARSWRHEGDKSLLLNLLKSDIPFVRALAARSLTFGYHSRVESSEILSVLVVLSPLEQLYVLAEWIFELRSKANLQNYREDEELKRLRIEIFDQMRVNFPENLSQEELYSLIRRLSGIGEGDWSTSINEDFIIPLLNDARLPIEQITELWLSLLVRKLTRYIESPINNQDAQEYAATEPTFHGLDGVELIQVCVWAIVNSDAARKTFWLGELSRLWNKAQGILAQPFLKYRKYKTWYQASLCLLWLVLLTRVLMQSKDLDEFSKQSMLRFSESIESILDATFEENPQPLKQWLWDIASDSSEI